MVTPLQYRAKVTRKRVCIVSVSCWIYFLLFGFVFLLLQKHYALMGTLYNVQILCVLICIGVINIFTWYRFYKYSQAPKHWMTSMRGTSPNDTPERKDCEQSYCNCHLCISIVFNSLVHRSDDIVHLLTMQFLVVGACALYRCRCHLQEFCNHSIFVRVECS